MSSPSADAMAPGDPRAPGYHGRGARTAGLLFTGIWLLYLIQPVAGLFNRRNSDVYTAGGLTVIVVFCAVYLILVPRWPLAPRHALPGLATLAALAALACLAYGRGGGTTSLWIFVSAASGLLVPAPRSAIRAVLASAVFYVIFGLTDHLHRTDFLINLLPVVFVGLTMIGLRRQFELTNQLRQARAEVAKAAANEERLRLARDLHDLTGQSLSMITLKSELAARLLRRLPEGADRDRAIAETQEVAAVSRQTLHDIREAVSGYRRPTLAVEIITARTALESAGITPHDDADLILLSGSFDPGAEAALAWCLREAATNVIRHSGARNCHISLARRDRELSLEVRDDGAGYRTAASTAARAAPEAGETPASPPPASPPPASPPPASPPPASGMGLRGMSERLAAVGGHLEVRPSGHGFRLVATVPAAPAGSAPAGSAPAGSAPAGSAPAGSAGKRAGINVTS